MDLVSFQTALHFVPSISISDYLLSHSSTQKSKKGIVIQVETIWTVITGLGSIWPSRTEFNGENLGDVWPCEAIRPQGSMPTTAEHFVPFHKLSQWLTYSLIEPITKILGATVEGMDLLTGLPEYRNGIYLIYFLWNLCLNSQNRILFTYSTHCCYHRWSAH